MATMHLQPWAPGGASEPHESGATHHAGAGSGSPRFVLPSAHRRDVVVTQRHVVRHLLAGVDEHNFLPPARAVRASAPRGMQAGARRPSARASGTASVGQRRRVSALGDDFPSAAGAHGVAAPAATVPQPTLDGGRGLFDAALHAAQPASTA